MLEITPLSAFDDNYIWMIHRPGCKEYVAVDPGDETPVLQWLEQQDGVLKGILITHHHYDHTGGIPELLEAYPGIAVYGPAREQIRGVNQRVSEGDRISLEALGASFSVMDVPGHTAGHVAYLGEGALFCGDTLFAAGCGRVFDGTLEQLATSLQRIASLPGQTLIYCAHEYTLTNLGFAAWVEPDSVELKQRILAEQTKRNRGEPTLPSPLFLELATNPFLRTDKSGVKRAAERFAGTPLPGHAETFSALRTWKDQKYD